MFDWIIKVVSSLGYAGVALLTFLEHLFPPLPSEVILPLAGFVAARGQMTATAVIAAGSLGSLGGAWVWYEIGRRVGKARLLAWVDRHGIWITLSAHDIERAQQWFDRHGRAAVLFGRMIPGVRTFVSLPAGFSAMPRWPFLLYTMLGTVGWTAALTVAGLILEANYEKAADYVNAVASVLLIGLVLLMVKRYLACWRAGRAPGGS